MQLLLNSKCLLNRKSYINTNSTKSRLKSLKQDYNIFCFIYDNMLINIMINLRNVYFCVQMYFSSSKSAKVTKILIAPT